MYPPAPAAQAAIRVDGQGFTINGQPTYVASGSIHYARVPRALWRDRLLRLKRAGFNTVETYAFWNFHEPRENEWDFTGDKDFGAFLARPRNSACMRSSASAPTCAPNGTRADTRCG